MAAPASIDATLTDAINTDTAVEEILLAATNHDLPTLTTLLQTHSPKVQDAETGYSPLHAAIAACEPDDDLHDSTTADATAAGDALNTAALGEETALETVALLLQNGAIWNELDAQDETPGCMALRLGLGRVYEAMVEAGVRAELLFDKLDGYEELPDEDGEEEVEQVVVEQQTAPGAEEKTVAAVETEPVASEHEAEHALANPNVNSEDYLKSTLTYSGDRLLDSDKNAVMMDWETEIMKTSADQLCTRPGLRTMNVGFGMGIVDAMFLANNPAEHHIVEAHPQVIERLREKGWFEKPNVRIHEGRWQDVLPKLVAEGVVLDAMYYDTYAEDYKDLKEFFDEYVIALLDSEGKFGFYNGLGADRQVCYDVYTKVVEFHLDDAGLDVEWTDIAVPDLAGRGEWEGVRRPYWANIKTYRLPTCKFMG